MFILPPMTRFCIKVGLEKALAFKGGLKPLNFLTLVLRRGSCNPLYFFVTTFFGCQTAIICNLY